MNNDPLIFEQWKYITSKSVPNIIENAYMISNFGRVYSNLRNIFIKPAITNNGYYRVPLHLTNNTCRYYLIHRIVMIEFNYIDNYTDMQVNHKDGDKSYNYENNLEWMTGSENIIHAYKNGLKTQRKGEDCSYSTITNEQAEKIGYLLSLNKYTHKEISNIVNCAVHIVNSISTGTTWKDIFIKYNLKEQQREPRIGFSDNDLIKLCKYFELNKNKYSTNTELFKHALMDLFGIIYTNNMSASLSRIINHKTRQNITNKYNF